MCSVLCDLLPFNSPQLFLCRFSRTELTHSSPFLFNQSPLTKRLIIADPSIRSDINFRLEPHGWESSQYSLGVEARETIVLPTHPAGEHDIID